jgi:2'-5' RNA ligase
MSSSRVPDQRTSVWGVLARADEERLTTLISRIARKYGVAAFRPHITLVSGVTRDAMEARSIMTTMASATPQFALRFTSVTHSSSPFRAVVLECEPDCEALNHLREALIAAFGVRSTTPFRPHLSVVYGSLSETYRRDVAFEVKGQLNRPVTIASLALVDTGGEDANTWTAVPCEFTLQRP